MTSCVDSACPEHSQFDIDELYYEAPRCGLDEDSFNTLFHYSLLVCDGRDVATAYASYCNELLQENTLREEMHRQRLVAVSFSTLSDLAACQVMLRTRHLLSAAAARTEVDQSHPDIVHILGSSEGAA